MRTTAARWALVVGLVLAAFEVSARPGGGHSYTGSSHSSGSSSSRSSSRSSSSSSSSYKSKPSSSSSSKKSTSSSSRGSSSSYYSAPPTGAYCILDASSRAGDRLTRSPGSLGPFGPTPAWSPPQYVWQSDQTNLRTGMTVLFFLLLLVPILFFGLEFGGAGNGTQGWTTGKREPKVDVESADEPDALPAPAPPGPREQLGKLRDADPDFSVVLFEDFVAALYAEAHTARGAGTLDRLAPYLSARAREKLATMGASPVSAVVIGAQRLEAVSHDAGAVQVTVVFEACLTEQRGESSQALYLAERWFLTRAGTAKSRAPDAVRVFACPNCGAPLEKVLGGVCGNCSKVVEGGAFDWSVSQLQLVSRQERPPQLTGTSEETGTELSTVFAPDLAAKLEALKQRDPAFAEPVLLARVGLIFETMQAAWSSLKWEGARPYLSDGLFTSSSYWIDAYRAQRLRNVTEGARVTKFELVRVDSDRWFDAVTVRLWATGLDYTLRDADGAVVGGNRETPRAYSEYWTLVRGFGKTGTPHGQGCCPHCGAPLQVSMAARCAHCGVKVNSGEFDWVLSRIEQDEAYGS